MATATRTLYVRSEDGTQRARLLAGDEIPSWATVTNPKATGDTSDDTDEDDVLLGYTKEQLLGAADALGVEASGTKKDIVAAIREDGYDGDGSDLIEA